MDIPSIEQLRNYIYRYKEKLIAENYPQVKGLLTEICQKTYNAELTADEIFLSIPNLKKAKSLYY